MSKVASRLDWADEMNDEALNDTADALPPPYFPPSVEMEMTQQESPQHDSPQQDSSQPDPPQQDPPQQDPSPTDSLSVSAEPELNEVAAGPENERLVRIVALEAAGRSSVILYSWNLLGDILDRHEDSLRKRWMKKSKTWRKMILSKIWPDMALFHRPDIDHLVRETERLLEEGTLVGLPTDPFIWPYINMQDLTRDLPIVCLLNTRARYSPATFVDHELEICNLGIESKLIKPTVKLNGYTMHLEGETVDSYGKLVAWGDNGNLRAGFTPADGLLILEIQQKAMDFLVKWCELILDKPADVLVDQFPIGRRLAPVVIVSQWPTIEILTTHAPYVIPVQTNFYRLKEFIDARHSAAQDHIWALREDPGYFQDTLLQYSAHQSELIPNSMRLVHWTYNTAPFWDQTLAAMVSHAYHDVAVWDVLAKQARLVVHLQNKHARELDPRYPLPPEYRKQIYLLKGLLLHSTKHPHTNMQNMLPASPRMRDSWEREILDGKWMAWVRSDVDLEHDPLLWVYLKLGADDEYHRYGHKSLVDEMERLVFAQPEQNERISALVAMQFSDLGLSVLMQHEVENYHPWAAEFKPDDSIDIWVIEQLAGVHSDFLELGRKRSHFILDKVGTPHDLKFSYPRDQRQTRSNTQTMWKAEKSLDLFWQEVDKQYEKMTGKTLEKAFANRFTVKLELERTPEWIEHFKELFTEQDDRKDAKAKVKDLDKTMSSLKLQDKNSPTKDAASQAALPDDLQQIFKLDQRASRAFKALFYTPSDQDGPKEITWGDFLHFMSAMQFSSLKLYGRLWHFYHQFSRPIQFHESGRILLQGAIRMGRRLKRTYEWHREMFVLEEGQGKGKAKRKRRGKGKGKASEMSQYQSVESEAESLD